MEIDDITKLLGLRQVTEGYYKGIVLTHKFDNLDDYGRGFLYLSIGQINIANTSAFTLSTIDDGSWCCYTNDKIDTNLLAERFTEEFGYRLPTEEVLNEFLRDFGLYGINIG